MGLVDTAEAFARQIELPTLQVHLKKPIEEELTNFREADIDNLGLNL
jgi:hypothetical protein